MNEADVQVGRTHTIASMHSYALPLAFRRGGEHDIIREAAVHRDRKQTIVQTHSYAS